MAAVVVICADHQADAVQGLDGRWRCGRCRRDIGFQPVTDEFQPAQVDEPTAVIAVELKPDFCPLCLSSLDEERFCWFCGRSAA